MWAQTSFLWAEICIWVKQMITSVHKLAFCEHKLIIDIEGVTVLI